MEESPWLQVADAARYLGISPNTLRKWADAGDLSFVRTKYGHRRFLKSELNDFIEEHRVRPRENQVPRDDSERKAAAN